MAAPPALAWGADVRALFDAAATVGPIRPDWRPWQVLGGPGTGKTALLIDLAAERIAAGADPESVLVLTHSKQAASTVRDAITARLSGPDTTEGGVPGATREPLVRTLHSYAFSVLRRHASAHGNPPPRLLTGAEQDAVLREMLRGDLIDIAAGAGGLWPERLQPALGLGGFAEQLRDLMLRATERGLGPEDLVRLGREHGRPEWVAAGKFAVRYEQSMLLRWSVGVEAPEATAPALDAAELVGAALDALAGDADLLAAERNRIRYLLVDDAQHLDPQAALLVQVMGTAAHTAVVAGDPDQGVFAFRGADARFVADLAAPDGQRIVLRDNHRSGGQVQLALARIAAKLPGSAPQRFSAPGHSVEPKDDGTAVRVRVLATPAKEAALIADHLRRAHLTDGVPWSRMAVIVRSVPLSLAPLRRALLAAGVPVQQPALDAPLARRRGAAWMLLALRAVLAEDAERRGRRRSAESMFSAEDALDLLAGPLGGADQITLRRLRRGIRRSVLESARSEIKAARAHANSVPGAEPDWAAEGFPPDAEMVPPDDLDPGDPRTDTSERNVTTTERNISQAERMADDADWYGIEREWTHRDSEWHGDRSESEVDDSEGTGESSKRGAAGPEEGASEAERATIGDAFGDTRDTERGQGNTEGGARDSEYGTDQVELGPHAPAPGADDAGRSSQRTDQGGVDDAERSADDSGSEWRAYVDKSSAEVLRDLLVGRADRRIMERLTDVEAAPLKRVFDALDRAIRTRRRGAGLEDVLWALWTGSRLERRWVAQSERGGAAGMQADRDLDAAVGLFDAAAAYVDRLPRASIEGFVEYLVQQEIPHDTRSLTAPGEAVALLSAHASAGREWDVVAVAAVQEGIWPNPRPRGTLLQTEDLVDLTAGIVDAGDVVSRAAPIMAEERRLLLVACSRARRSLLVTAVESVSGERDLVPSRFLAELLGHDDESEPGALPVADPGRALVMHALVAELRGVVCDSEAEPERRRRAAHQLARLAHAGVPGTHPDHWYGTADLSSSRSLWDEDDAAVALSPSTVELLRTCPLRWALERHGGTDGDNPHAVKGNLVHTLVQALAGKVPESQVRAALDKAWQAIDPGTGWHSRQELRRTEAMLETFMAWVRNTRGELTQAGVEVPVDCVLPPRTEDERAVRIRGRVDRLERDAFGRFVIVDVKTGKSPVTKQAAADHAQLATYQVAAAAGALDITVGESADYDSAQDESGTTAKGESGAAKGESGSATGESGAVVGESGAVVGESDTAAGESDSIAAGSRAAAGESRWAAAEPGGARLVYVAKPSSKEGATQRMQPALDAEALEKWRGTIHDAAAATQGPSYLAMRNDGCRHCSVAGSCPVQDTGRQVTDE
ncbi:PD-(D/E)XK nuclease family protein [Nocardia nepalensis]|uniref:PD-(D/E)XK nuclease family protein n=1 Tax=Nocardia nepalensis TaxID=3375448 RepID=UPI003B67AF4C